MTWPSKDWFFIVPNWAFDFVNSVLLLCQVYEIQYLQTQQSKTAENSHMILLTAC